MVSAKRLKVHDGGAFLSSCEQNHAVTLAQFHFPIEVKVPSLPVGPLLSL